MKRVCMLASILVLAVSAPTLAQEVQGAMCQSDTS